MITNVTPKKNTKLISLFKHNYSKPMGDLLVSVQQQLYMHVNKVVTTHVSIVVDFKHTDLHIQFFDQAHSVS